MSAPDLERVSKEQILEWFANAPEGELVEILRNAQPAQDTPAPLPGPGVPSIPLLLTGIRLPVDLVRDVDDMAAAEGVNRSEVIRAAVSRYVSERRTGSVGPTEAEQALDVLRRVVGEHVKAHREAAWPDPVSAHDVGS